VPARPKLKAPNPDWFDHLPDAALIREQQIIPGDGNPSPLVNVSSSTWRRWTHKHSALAPIKLSSGVTVWQVGQLRKWLASQGAQA
jgi:hypothetical protein